MSSQQHTSGSSFNTSSSGSLPPPSVSKSGVQSVLEYTGIPPSWFSKRPKLPSRNWLIFLSVTSSIVGAYIYDRRQCKNIRSQYVERVKHLSEEKLDDMAWARKVTVYGSKWPGDEDSDRSMKYFRKYVKPIFVAAAVDYEMINGRRHGDLANRISDKIKAQRRLDAGLDNLPEYPMRVPTRDKSLYEKRRHELEGGVVVIGRHTFKEFMAGLKRGWTDGLEKLDKEELLARELADDGHFDELEDLSEFETSEDQGSSRSSSPPVFSPLQHIQSQASPKPSFSDRLPPSVNTPPATIPPLPPVLLIPFTNYIGFTQIPYMLYDFFTQRRKVQAGAEAAYRLIMNHTRPFIVPVFPTMEPDFTAIDRSRSRPSGDSDLDFDKQAESYYKPSTASIPADIESAREKYYKSLPGSLSIARDLARGTKELTKAEVNDPPKTEVELRAERMKKESRWRADSEGWAVVKPDAEVTWDERFREVLKVFVDPSPGDAKRADRTT